MGRTAHYCLPDPEARAAIAAAVGVGAQESVNRKNGTDVRQFIRRAEPAGCLPGWPSGTG